jgi:hypothetical protein
MVPIEKSKFENVGNVQLFFTLKIIIKEYGNSSRFFDVNTMSDSGFYDSCDIASKTVGVGDITFIDYNYLLSVLLLNEGFDFDEKKPNGTLARPSVSRYSFDVDEDYTSYGTRTYQNKLESYLEELVIPMAIGMEGEGSFDYYDGDVIYDNIYDGETTDFKIKNRSVVKIK